MKCTYYYDHTENVSETQNDLFYVILLSYVTVKFILLKTNSLRTNENKY